MDNTVTEMINAFEEFVSSTKQKNHRYLSWEHCYQQFRLARLERDKKEPDLDYLSLQLAFYLASWGMYRGSSFLLQRDYKVHIPIVKEILKPEYDCLQGLECDNMLADKIVQERLVEIDTKLEQFYKAIRQSVVNKPIKNAISKILITKVLLGTLGCTPAYDRFFIIGARKTKVTSGLFSLHSMKRLSAFYEENKSQFEAVREKYRIGDQRYPQMKLLDMALWQIGAKSQNR